MNKRVKIRKQEPELDYKTLYLMEQAKNQSLNVELKQNLTKTKMIRKACEKRVIDAKKETVTANKKSARLTNELDIARKTNKNIRSKVSEYKNKFNYVTKMCKRHEGILKKNGLKFTKRNYQEFRKKQIEANKERAARRFQRSGVYTYRNKPPVDRDEIRSQDRNLKMLHQQRGRF